MAEAKKGAFTFVLHSHLPYVLSHGRWPHGTDWLNEACAETYIPILDMLHELVAAGITPNLTISISPVLCEQLAHKSFRSEFCAYLDNKIQAAITDKEIFDRHGDTHMAELAEMWIQFYMRTKDHYENRYNHDMPNAFKELQDSGQIEIMTCAATHGYLPLLSQDTTIQAQVKLAVQSYEKYFGRKPRGIWLPECAYRPRYEWQPPVEVEGLEKKYLRKGVEEFLSENGIEYFIIDTALLKGGKAIGIYIDRFKALKKLWGQFEKEYKPKEELKDRSPQEIYLVSSGGENKTPVAVFTRDPDTGLQVWSGVHGYPGDGHYLDFHKKRFPGGHRYWEVTSAKSDLADKKEYEPKTALNRVPENAAHFKSIIKGILSAHFDESGQKGFLCAPFDCELFGHWWFEGVNFLKLVIEYTDHDAEIETQTCSQFLDEAQPTKVISIPEGSWGEGGYHYIWMNEWTEWSWKHIYNDELWMQSLAKRFKDTDDKDLKKILQQAARELMILIASDWQFLISTWAARDYAEMRIVRHHKRFKRLAQMAENFAAEREVDKEDWTFLGDMESQDSIFPDIKIEWFAESEFPANQ
jgi:1,4-alpha-glucan branching enzyme